ncbi:MAG: hypothetical protein JOZ38_06760, partial [Candidatus Eremiobacteraeota bacterium]|nr:hypothetical protein [Candidatus Eremiobacteraeota bacterium]
MKRTLRLLVAAFGCSFALAACGGGGGGNALPSGGGGANHMESVLFQIVIPRTGSSTARKPQFVDAATQSVTVAVNNGSPTTVNTTASSSGCTSTPTKLTCSITVQAPAGSDTFAVNMYSAQNAGGSLLSSGTTTATIGSGSNVVTVTMNGVPTKLVVSLSNAFPPTGSPSTITVNVIAYDATGAQIVGPGNYSVPVTLTDSDTSGHTSLTVNSVAGPSATGTLTYDGNAAVTSASIGATASGVTGSNITPATLQPGSVSHLIAGGSGAIAILTINGTTYAFTPSGTGVAQVEVSNGSTISSTARQILATRKKQSIISVSPVPDECTADPTKGYVYCIGFNSNVVTVLNANVVPAVQLSQFTTDAPAGGVPYSAGSCTICGALFDPTDKAVVISTGNGYELYNSSGTKLKTIAAPVAENFGYNASTNQIFSGQYSSGTTIDLDDVASATRYTLSPTPADLSEPDSNGV